jgi:hypothetical protein
MSAQTSTITPAKTSVAGRPWLSFLIRGALAILALWLLHYAFSRELAWYNAHLAPFNKWDMGPWTYWLGMAALAGLAFGLAGSMPWPLTPIRYRLSRLLLAAVAAVPIAWVTYVFGYLLPRNNEVGGWEGQTARWFGPDALFGLAVLVGVAVASGLARPDAGRHAPPPRFKSSREAETYSF